MQVRHLIQREQQNYGQKNNKQWKQAMQTQAEYLKSQFKAWYNHNMFLSLIHPIVKKNNSEN